MRTLITILLLFNIAFAQVDTICIKCKQVVTRSTAIGVNSVAGFSQKFDTTATGGGEAVALGNNAKTYSWRGVAIGVNSIAGATSSTAVGFGAVANKVHGIAIGRGAYIPNYAGSFYGIGFTSVPAVVGCNTTDFGIGNWWGHKYKIPPSGIEVGNKIPSQITLMYHGQDAYDDTTNEVDVAGGHIGIAAGRGTGKGISGEIRFYTAPSSTITANVKNPLSIAAKITQKGVRLTRMTTAQRLAMIMIPDDEGTIVYDLSYHNYFFYNGSSWVMFFQPPTT